ncbi:hypothetical protein, partial [Microbispora rosea]
DADDVVAGLGQCATDPAGSAAGVEDAGAARHCDLTLSRTTQPATGWARKIEIRLPDAVRSA